MSTKTLMILGMVGGLEWWAVAQHIADRAYRAPTAQELHQKASRMARTAAYLSLYAAHVEFEARQTEKVEKAKAGRGGLGKEPLTRFVAEAINNAQIASEEKRWK